MEQLNKEYMAILSGDENASEKFWTLERRINHDKRSVGVIAEMKRSNVYPCLAELLKARMITFKELEGFSDELITALSWAI